MGTGILNRRHFVFYHGDAPCFKLDILNLNFPPHRYKNTILNLNYYQILVGLEVACPAGTREVPGSSSGDPQSKKDIFAFSHQKWREIQSEYVEFGTRSIPMVKNKMAAVQETCPHL